MTQDQLNIMIQEQEDMGYGDLIFHDDDLNLLLASIAEEYNHE